MVIFIDTITTVGNCLAVVTSHFGAWTLGVNRHG